ncbi:alpha/beta fold hydrolase [Ekhidna sp.]|uniref:alpha/beta fold hydrolase n=1 Tax=Ekhidna sp. TaxID=2608089 RepID=UPI003B50BA97
MKPITQYTKSGSINIAYQVFGSGTKDLVYIPGWVSNIDLMWACPELVSFLLELGKVARVILFDKRGTGLSDRLVEFSTLEERMDDIRAVMDAVGSEKAILFGHSEGGSASALFAATYPDRTLGMISFGIFAKRRYSKDYPWAPTDEERKVVYDMIENSWGSGDMDLESLAPSKADDKKFMDWLSNYFRSGASPSAAMVLTKMNTQVDIIDILGSIKVPALIMQRTHDIDVKVEEGRFIADRIRNSKFIELEGQDHLFWVGNTKNVLKEIKDFLYEIEPEKSHDERLFTIVAGKLKGETDEGSNVKVLIKEIIKKGKGKNTQFDGLSFISTFDGPSKAVNCGMDLVNFMKSLSIEIAIVIDMKEGAISGNNLVNVSNKEFVDALLNESQFNQILVSQAVRYLLSGADVSFSEYGYLSIPGMMEKSTLYLVSDPNDIQTPILRDDAFLESIIKIIEKNYNKEHFSVDMLCKEVGISERQLQRKLKAITNKSPIQLISSVRLHQAKELLQSSGQSISEVAYMTGFNNPSYFAKSFKKEFGISPSSINSAK